MGGADEARTSLCVEGSTVSVAIGMASDHVSWTGGRRTAKDNWRCIKRGRQEEENMR